MTPESGSGARGTTPRCGLGRAKHNLELPHKPEVINPEPEQRDDPVAGEREAVCKFGVRLIARFCFGQLKPSGSANRNVNGGNFSVAPGPRPAHNDLSGNRKSYSDPDFALPVLAGMTPARAWNLFMYG